MTDSLRELQGQILQWWALASRPCTKFAGHAPPALPAHITYVDAASFLRGLRREPPLYVVHGNTFLSQLLSLNQPGGRRETDKRYTFFEMSGGDAPTPGVRDESVVHYATATELIEQFHWSPEQVVSEPLGFKDQGLADGSVDM